MPSLNFVIILGISGIIIFFSYLILEKKMNVVTVPGKRIAYDIPQIIFRGGIGGMIIAVSILVSKIFGPELAGIFASFPALTVAMIIIISTNQSVAFLHSLLKNFIISSAVIVIAFVVCVRYTFLSLGIYFGTMSSLVVSGVVAYFMFNYVNKKLR